MPSDSAIIDRIVAGVLTQLGGGVRGAEGLTTQAPRRAGGETRETSRAQGPQSSAVELSAKVVTAEVLESVGPEVRHVMVSAKVIVTPAAWDVAKARGLTIDRQAASAPGRRTGTPSAQHSTPSTPDSLLIIVHHTDAAGRVWEHLQARWRRDFLGCPDDAAKLAISELARGGVSQVVILAEQTHRAACLANRHASVKAAAIRDVTDIAAVRQQIRANVWCLDPAGKSWFELKRLFAALGTGN